MSICDTCKHRQHKTDVIWFCVLGKSPGSHTEEDCDGYEDAQNAGKPEQSCSSCSFAKPGGQCSTGANGARAALDGKHCAFYRYANDPVNSPSHYQLPNGIEVIDIIEALALDFCRGNVLKYLLRAGKKAGSSGLEDLKKARWYLNRAIAKQERE